MIFGEQNSGADTHQQLDYTVTNSINLIGVAGTYPAPSCPETQGLTETYVGSWLVRRGNRERLVLVSKTSGSTRSNDSSVRPNHVLDHKNIREALYASLRRLQTDYLDLCQVRWPQRPTNYFGKLGYIWINAASTTTLLDTFEVLTEFQYAGKIRYIGVSNETAFGVMYYLRLVDKRSLPWIVTIQNPYSLLNRSSEVSLVEVSQFEGVESLTYSCPALGTLTGKYLNGAKPAGARNMLLGRFARYSSGQSQKAVAAHVDIVKRRGPDPTQVTLAFVRRQSFVTSTLLGMTTIAQLQASVEGLQFELNEEVLAEIKMMHQVCTHLVP